MKKFFFIAAMASVAFVSCVKNDPAPSVTEQQEIVFAAPVVGTATKVNGAIGTTYNTDEAFDVWCVYNTADITEWGGTPYFSDVKATYSSTVNGWGLEDKYYWPATGELSFVALSPSIENKTAYDQANGFNVKAWSQGASENAIVDLMYSDMSLNNEKATFVPGPDNDDDATYKYDGVDIMFHHALSYIAFKIKTSADYSATTSFKLNEISLSGIYTTGEFTQKATDPWVEETSAVGVYVAYTNDAGLSFTSTAVAADAAAGKEMILLPQALLENQQKVTIKYQISTDSTTWLDQEQTVDLKNMTVEEWQMGKKYTYTISIGMYEIYFDPAVTDWDPIGGGTIEF